MSSYNKVKSTYGVPRLSPENFHKNLELVDKVKEVAARHSTTPGQVVLAWHAQGDDVFPILVRSPPPPPSLTPIIYRWR